MLSFDIRHVVLILIQPMLLIVNSTEIVKYLCIAEINLIYMVTVKALAG